MKNHLKVFIGISVFLSLILSNAGSLFAMQGINFGYKEALKTSALAHQLHQLNYLTIKDSNGITFKALKNVVLACQTIKDCYEDENIAQLGSIDFSSDMTNPKDRDSFILLFETIKQKGNPAWLASRTNDQIATIYELDRNLQARPISLAVKKEYKKRFPELAKDLKFKNEVRMLKNSVIKHNPEKLYLQTPAITTVGGFPINYGHSCMLDLSNKGLESLFGLEIIREIVRERVIYLDISHNNLNNINFDKLERLFPNLKIIDASHNCIEKVKKSCLFTKPMIINLQDNHLLELDPTIFKSSGMQLNLENNYLGLAETIKKQIEEVSQLQKIKNKLTYGNMSLAVAMPTYHAIPLGCGLYIGSLWMKLNKLNSPLVNASIKICGKMGVIFIISATLYNYLNRNGLAHHGPFLYVKPEVNTGTQGSPFALHASDQSTNINSTCTQQPNEQDYPIV